ncbi:MAG: hypothetical protein AB8C84_02085 [Oligoflexales bacterium]
MSKNGKSDLPLYVDNGIGLPSMRPPYPNMHMSTSSFFLKADFNKVKNLCDRYLNDVIDGNRKYYPISNRVMFTWAKIVGDARTDSYEVMGPMEEHDAVFFIPTLAVNYHLGIPVPSHFAFFPYRLYIDNADGIVSGREVYGFNKGVGNFLGSEDPKKPNFTIQTLAYKTFGPDNLAKMEDMVKITPMSSDISSEDKTWCDAQQAKEGIKEAFKEAIEGGFWKNLIEESFDFFTYLFQPQGTQVFLKQFRDIHNGLHACYQSVTEAPTTINKFSGGGLYTQKYKFQAFSLQSEPIAEELGLILDEDGCQENLEGFWAESTISLGLGEEIKKGS